MSKGILVACVLCVLTVGRVAYADETTIFVDSKHTFVTPLQDPIHYCYPPEGKAFSDYFSPEKCYYRFNNECSDARVVSYDANDSDPNQTQNNKNFFALCNTMDASQNTGPQFILYLDKNKQQRSCLLLPNTSNTKKTSTQLTVFTDPSGGDTSHVPGCPPENYAILNLQAPNPAQPPTYKVTCESYFGDVSTGSAVLDPNTLDYTVCPSPTMKQHIQ